VPADDKVLMAEKDIYGATGLKIMAEIEKLKTRAEAASI